MTASDSLEKKDIRKKTAEAKKRMDKLQREFPKRQNEIENEAKNEIDSFNRLKRSIRYFSSTLF